uniref:Uncharacterized protein n=1 Tax=Coccidioides posadasii RMSCC 3488 TaxID=454284 RepID=A0A0J6FHA7_COCPO|nr:hypothetical protein CPAG_05059 [Coccidioides posadasii RMSCC 3488]
MKRLKISPHQYIKKLSASMYKLWLDWLKATHKHCIKSDKTIWVYWRRLKMFYEVKHKGNAIDDATTKDCINYTWAMIDRWEEKNSAGLLLSYISGSRLVSLFETKARAKPSAEGELWLLDEDNEEISVVTNAAGRSSAGERGTLSEPLKAKLASEYQGGRAKVESWMAQSDSDRSHPLKGKKHTYDSLEEAEISTSEGDMETDTAYQMLRMMSVLDSDGTHENSFNPRNLSGDDESVVTDDGYHAGDKKKDTCLWRHIPFHIVCVEAPGQSNTLLAKVTLIHTKGRHLSLCTTLNQYSISLGILFGYCTSEWIPLKGTTWARNLNHIGIIIGLICPLEQYVFQQTFINKINNKVLVLVWDQVADHDSNAVKYYLDNVVHADIEVITMELPPREAVQVMAYSLGLDADLVIWVMGYSSVAAAAGTPLYQEKMKIQTQLNSAKVYLWNHYCGKSRKQHFHHADTECFNC